MRGKTQEDRQLLDLLDPVAEACGYAIVRLRLMSGRERRRLQIMAERPEDGDMGIDDCTRLSRAISDIFDAAPDLINGEFVLEVSSPGIDRPLTRLADFETYAGLEARLELDRMAEGRKRFKGELAGLDGENVAIDLEGDDHTALIPFSWITDAKLVLNDELMAIGAAARAQRIENGEEEDIPEDDEEEAAAPAPSAEARAPRSLTIDDGPVVRASKPNKAKKKPKAKSNSRKSSIFSGD
jgi:ribosome maturation factor RimP